MSHQSLIVCLSIVLFNLHGKDSVQSYKTGLNGQPYDSTVDKLCGQFASDRDQMQSYMQGLSYRAHDYDYQKGDFYLAYHDHLYSWQMTDMDKEEVYSRSLALWSMRPKTVDFKSVDPLKALGKWNEIAWIKPILDANGVDGNDVKLIRLKIYASSGPDKQSQIEISFQRNGQHQVDTLLATNETGVAELRQDYMPECSFSGIPTDKTYIFRYDDKGQVVVSWRKQQDSAEEGPFYMYTERNTKYPDSYCSLQFHSTSPPPKAYSSYIVHTPLFTQLPIYGLIGGYVHLWDLPNHRVYYFMHSGQFNRLNNASFEKYFDCPVESTTSGTSQEGPTQERPTLSIPSQEDISKHPQGEPGQQFLDESNSQATVTQSAPTQSNIWLYIVLGLLGLAVLFGLCVFLARKRKRKQRLSKLKAKMMRTKTKQTKGKKSSSQVSPSKSSSNFLGSSTSNKSTISSVKSGSNASKSVLKTKTPIATSKTSSKCVKVNICSRDKFKA